MSKRQKLLGRVEKWAIRMSEEHVYATSYDVGSPRWHQAKERARRAEEKFTKALTDLRAELDEEGKS